MINNLKIAMFPTIARALICCMLCSATLLSPVLFFCSGSLVSSPDGTVTAQIVQEDDILLLKILLGSSEAACWQIGGVAFTKVGYDFTGTLVQKSASVAQISEEYTLPAGKVSVYQNKANEITVSYANDYGNTMHLSVRAYNDGVAFRYAFDNNVTLQVREERTMLSIPETSNVWAMEYMKDSEGYYLKRSPSEMTQPLYHLPALVETPDGNWLLVHEADVLGRSAAASLSAHKGDGRFALSADYPDLLVDDNNTITASHERGIVVYGREERKNLDTPEKRADIYGEYKKLGIDGIKIDYINSYTQRACDFRQACLSDAVKVIIEY